MQKLREVWSSINAEFTCELLARHGKNWRIQSQNILDRSSGLVYITDGDYKFNILFCCRLISDVAKVTRTNVTVGKSNERRLIPPAFFALSFLNELQYLNVRIKS